MQWLLGAGVAPGCMLLRRLRAARCAKLCTILICMRPCFICSAWIMSGLTFYHNEIRRRLTDVYGHVIRKMLCA
jgi:hypothetical protein